LDASRKKGLTQSSPRRCIPRHLSETLASLFRRRKLNFLKTYRNICYLVFGQTKEHDINSNSSIAVLAATPRLGSKKNADPSRSFLSRIRSLGMVLALPV
jgi:hypothetical protein